jgi:hypothetical protein
MPTIHAALPLAQPQHQSGALGLLMQFMSRPDLDLGKVEAVWAIYEKAAAKEAETAAARDWARFKAKNLVVMKTDLVRQRKADGGAGPTFWQSEMDEVARVLQPALSECGFSYAFDHQFVAGPPWTVEVSCEIRHVGGHVVRKTVTGPIWETSGSMNTLQKLQCSSTFMQRNLVLAMTGTAQKEPADPNAAAPQHGEGQQNYGGSRSAPRAEAAQPSEAAADLVKAGNAKAEEGMEALTKWWGSLDNRQRATVSPEFGRMRKVAAQADKKAAA